MDDSDDDGDYYAREFRKRRRTDVEGMNVDVGERSPVKSLGMSFVKSGERTEEETNGIVDKDSEVISNRSHGMVFSKAGSNVQSNSGASMSMGSMFSRDENDYSDLEASDEQEISNNEEEMDNSENTYRPSFPLNVATAPSSAKLKTYGIGARLLHKMGYVEGKGLGKDGEGIEKPIETKLRPQGLGVGGVQEKNPDEYKSEDSDMDDFIKTYRRDLFTIIEEMESNGMNVPRIYKEMSDSQIHNGSKFLKETHASDDYDVVSETLERLLKEWKAMNKKKMLLQGEKTKLNGLAENNRLRLETESMALQFCEQMKNLMNDDIGMREKIEATNSLIVSFLNSVVNTHTIDIEEMLVSAIKPLMIELVSTENRDLIKDQLEHWNEILRDHFAYDSDELNYMESMTVELVLPIVKSSLEDWNIEDPIEGINIIKNWEDILPKVVIVNIYEDVVLLKLTKGIKDWQIRSSEDKKDISISLAPHLFVIEWLSILPQIAIDEIINLVYSKYEFYFHDNLKKPEGIDYWKHIFGVTIFDKLIEDTLLPTLVGYLHKELVINPSKQSLTALNILFQLETLLTKDQFEYIFQFEFFNKWFIKLADWLANEHSSLIDIANWIEMWTEWFDRELDVRPIVRQNFQYCHKLISEYINSLSSSTFFKLSVPSINGDTQPAPKLLLSFIKNSKNQQEEAKPTKAPAVPISELSYTFKDIVNDYCSQHSLLFISNNNISEMGIPLYNISRSLKGKKLSCYIKNDVLWCKIGEKFEAISLDELVRYVG